MSSRRNVSRTSAPSSFEADHALDPSAARVTGEKSDVSPAVGSDVIVKLLGFTLAMIVLPIGSYFATVDTIFGGNSSFAGGLAAVLANVVLIAYIVVAMREDQSPAAPPPQPDSKKAR